MPNIGPMELAIVAIIALVIFGPKRLPELGSSLGNGFREFKASISGDDEKPSIPAMMVEADEVDEVDDEVDEPVDAPAARS